MSRVCLPKTAYGRRTTAQARGRAEIEKMLTGVVPEKGEGPQRKHYITNIIIKVDGDSARSVSDYLVVRESVTRSDPGDGRHLQG